MADKNVFGFFKGLVGGKKHLEDLKMDDLKKEKVRLEQEERKYLMEVRQIEDQKKKLFVEGTSSKISVREQTALARKIQDMDMSARNKDRQMQANSKQMQIIDGLIRIKEMVRVNSESGLGNILKGLDLDELVVFVDKASIDGEFREDKFGEMLRALNQADAISPEMTEDSNVLDIVKEMQAAQQVSDNPESVDEHFAELNRTMDAKSKEPSEPEES